MRNSHLRHDSGTPAAISQLRILLLQFGVLVLEESNVVDGFAQNC